MNTYIEYLYRDGSNCKEYDELVVSGELHLADIQEYLDDGQFCPEDLNLRHPGESLPNFPIDGVDHAWCEITRVSQTRSEQVGMSAKEFIERFQKAAANGWPASRDTKYCPAVAEEVEP